MAAQLTAAQRANMTPAQIAAWNQRASSYAATQTPTATPAPAPTTTPFSVIPKPVVTKPQIIPKPTVNPTTGAPLGSTPVNGSQPLVPPSSNTASMITGVAPAQSGASPQSPPPPNSAPSMGGNAPVSQSPFPVASNPQQVYQPNMGAGQVVQDYMTELLGENSGYIQSARRSGIEQAANRGLLNSSIAAGNSQRAAIDAAQPILNQITNLHNQREQLAFTGEQNQMDRDQQITMARISDWAANNQFNREYNGNLSLLPIKNIMDLNAQLTQAAIDNPEIFPPEVVSGLGEFFGTNMLAMLQQWFPSQYGGT